MEKGKLIEKYIGDGLKPFGFQYKGYKGDAWRFEKRFKNITQTISIYQYRFDSNMISFDLFTDARETEIKQAVEIEGIEFNSNLPGFWLYEDEKTFVDVLQLMLQVMLRPGLKILNELSKEPKIIATNEMFETLYYNHEELAEKCKKKYGLDDTALDEEHINCWFELIEQQAIELKKKSFDEVKDELVELAAFLGEQLIRNLGGYWERFENKGYISSYVYVLNIDHAPVVNILNNLLGGYSVNGIEWTKGIYMDVYNNRII